MIYNDNSSSNIIDSYILASGLCHDLATSFSRHLDSTIILNINRHLYHPMYNKTHGQLTSKIEELDVGQID